MVLWKNMTILTLIFFMHCGAWMMKRASLEKLKSYISHNLDLDFVETDEIENLSRNTARVSFCWGAAVVGSLWIIIHLF